MPKLSQNTVVVPIVEATLELTPQQSTKLRKHFRQYALLAQKRKALEAQMDTEKGGVEDVLAEVGVEALAQDGFKAKIVAGVRKKFDPKRFVAKGGKLKIYNDSMVEVPVKAYVKISAPGDKEEEY